ncbi:GNAT family N-acetyltransferase [Streptomyces sp. NPDC056708]|uniref:GNAT family N-acetyltransferase n=1 Tax=unclassified Streptomyces TaxID=2593676 RepID=UPI003685A8D3
MMSLKPFLVSPVISPGCLASTGQPSLPVEGGLFLRPWRLEDAASVVKAFQDPTIQRWHHRRTDSKDEAREWITQWQQGWRDETAVHWTIADGENDTATAFQVVFGTTSEQVDTDTGEITPPR